MVSSLIFALTFKQVEIMEICYIEAGVLERMLARAENLSAHVDLSLIHISEPTRRS